MTSATDVLRRLLDERGVEYTEDRGYREFFWDFGEYGKARASGIGTRGLVQMIVTGIAPEQAIAATLGATDAKPTQVESSGTCHRRMEQEGQMTEKNGVERSTVYLVETSDELNESWFPFSLYLHREAAEDCAEALRREDDGILCFARVSELKVVDA